MTDRIAAIRAMLEKSPDDTMLHYSLGMEYAAAGQYDDAVASFKACIALNEGHVPAYVEAGKCLRSAGKLDAARAMFAEAMELAAMQGEPHMRDFIQQQLDGLPKG